MKTRRLLESLFFLLLAWAVLCQASFAKKQPPSHIPKILKAQTVYLDCDCRREMKASVPHALPELFEWGRYQLAPDRDHADLILLFSMHPYLGDYFTRDGPDKRPAIVDFTILTVIDGRTGEALWSESKRWGYMLVSKASRALMRDFRKAVEVTGTPGFWIILRDKSLPMRRSTQESLRRD